MTGNVFGNDTDADMGPNGKSGWTAVLVNASGVPVPTPTRPSPSPATARFRINTANGPLTFYYRIDTGTWTDGSTTADMSADSNIAMVTISVPPPADGTNPVVSIPITVTPTTIWSPNGKKLPVTLSGRATDVGTGIASFQGGSHRRIPAESPDPDEVFTFTVTAPVMNTPALKWNASTGAFSLVVQLTASRLGSDTNGRKYDLRVCATDKAGNMGCGHVGVGDGARQEQVDRDEKERRRPLDSSAAPDFCTAGVMPAKCVP